MVDLRRSRDTERKIVTHLGMQYVAMPWRCSFPKDETFAQFLTQLGDNPGKKVFVHCRVGDDRTGMMIASYSMAREGWSAEKAEKEMEKFAFSFTDRRLICPGLSSYEENFPQRLRPAPHSGTCVRRLSLGSLHHNRRTSRKSASHVTSRNRKLTPLPNFLTSQSSLW